MPQLRHRLAVLALAASAACSSPAPHEVPGVNPSAWPTAPDAFEGATRDDTPATASTILVPESQVRTLYPEGDVDWVKVYLNADVAYELSANRLSPNSDVVLFLFDTDGTTQLASNDHYLASDARLHFTPTASGTYYLRVQSFYSHVTGLKVGLAAYTLGVRTFVDADGDGWSSFYDCRDADASIHPLALEVTGDHVDQDCDGVDALDPALADPAEPDDTPATARALAVATVDPFEFIYATSLDAANARTILSPADVDWFYLSVPGRSAFDLGFRSAGTQGNVQLTVYASDASTEVRGAGPLAYRLENPGPTERRFYLKYSVTSGSSFYIPFAVSLGTDADGDGYYTQDIDAARDCNDANQAIHPGAAETASDTVDRNCNGVIGG